MKRWTHAHTILAAVALVILGLVWHFRVELGQLIMLGLLARIGWRKLNGTTGRRQPTFARNVMALSAAYAAFNSRWLKPTPALKVTVPRKAGQHLEPWDDEEASF